MKVKSKRKLNFLKVFLIYFFISYIYFFTAFSESLLIAPGDSWIQNYPLRHYYGEMLKNGDFSFWLPFEFLGTSLVGIMQAGVFYPLNLIYIILPYAQAFNISLILHYALAALFTYMYAKTVNLKSIPAFMAGLVFGFAGFLMAHKGHTSMMNAAIWLPLVIYFFEKIRITLNYKYVIWASIIIAIQVFAGHFQITVYTLMFLAFFVFFYRLKMDRIQGNRFIILSAITVMVGVILSSPQIISSFELSKEAWRLDQGYNYFIEYSFPPYMILTFFFPFIFGGGYGGEYWSIWNLTETVAFAGIFPLILGVVVFYIHKKKNIHIYFWGIAIILTFILALGGYTPIYKLFYHIPVYNMFRVPARHWLEFNLAISILFGFGIQYLLYDIKERSIFIVKSIKFYVVTALCLFGVLIVFKSLVGSTFINSSIQERIAYSLSLNNKAFYIPLIFIFCYLIWLIFVKYFKGNNLFLVLSIFMLVSFEVFSFGRFHDSNWIEMNKINDLEEVDSSLLYFKELNLIDRTFYLNNMHPHLLNLPLDIQKLNGYDPLINANLHDLLEMYPSGNVENDTGILKNNLILSMLNTKYIVSSSPIDVTDYLGNLRKYEEFIPVDLGEWSLFNAKYIEDNEGFILKSIDGINASLIQQQISLKPDSDYQISLNINIGEIPDTDETLFIDLYGEGYDNLKQEFSIDISNLDEGDNFIKGVINSGTGLPVETFIRFFTLSQLNIKITEITISEIEGFNPPLINISKDKLPENVLENQPLYKLVYSDENKVYIYENLNALSKIYSVNKLIPVDGIEEVKENLMQYKINPKETAMISPEDLEEIGEKNFIDGNLEIVEYKNDEIVIKSTFEGEGFAVLADQYTKDWKVYIDGIESEIYEVNGLLRGIEVPEGEHVIEFKYVPTLLFIFMGIGIVIFFILLLVGLYFNRKVTNDKE